MTPAMIGVILSLVETAISNEPQIAASLQKIFSKPNPTPADWQAERALVMGKSYKDLVPNTQLPDSETT